MPLQPNDWANIIEDIEAHKTVLLIGPEIMRFEGKTVDRCLRDNLFEHNSGDIAYYYDRDGLFLFATPEGKVRVARQVKRFYNTFLPDETILKRLTQIPFHLVVSLNPDTFLSETFYRYGVKHRFSYFKLRDRAGEKEEIEKPSSASPLIYNLFGSKDQDDSLILDYNDVYRMIQSTFGTSGLPDKFLRSFRDARTYIFLGFQFDKWYSQLLLKFLSDEAAKDKLLALKTTLNNPDTEAFLIHQFQIEFIDDQFDFFSELFDRCSQNNMLRPLPNLRHGLEFIKIRQHIDNGEPVEALGLLHHALRDTNYENEVIHLKARYWKLAEDIEKGIVHDSEYRVEYNLIVESMIRLAKNIQG